MYGSKTSITSTVYTSRREAPVGRRSSAVKPNLNFGQAPKPVTAFDNLGRPENLPDEIAQQLRSRILNESLAPGQRLPTEQELGAQFGVSRNVIREAIARLKLTGLVETRHGVGTFVCADLAMRPFEVSHDDLLELSQLIHVHQLRVEIESGAAALAATHRTKSQLDNLQLALKRVDLAGDDWETAAKSAVDFHLAVAHASNNPYFVRIMGHLSHVIHNAVRTTRFRNVGTTRIEEIEDEHHQLVDAIVRQDSAAARQIMRMHLENGLARYRNLFGDL
jgi:DNA-binding FadR family transcriptional regulator